MFSVEWLDNDDELGNSIGNIMYGNVRVCFISDWALSSCAAHGLMHWNRCLTFPVKDFWDFVSKINQNWNPQEAYFLLSSSQLEFLNFQSLVKDSRVKQVDSFENKAHGPNRVFLFRFSHNGDFT